LKTSLTEVDRARLEEFMNTLPVNAEAEMTGLVSSQM
jgi:hypothetical protein